MRPSVLLATGIAATAYGAEMGIQTALPNAAEQAPGPRGYQRRDLASCNSVATAVLPRITDAPTVPADVASYLAFSASVTDACANPTVTGSIGSAYSSYAKSLTSWQDAHITDFRAIWQACSDVQGVATVLPLGTGQCSSLVAAITSAGPVDAGGNGGGNGNGGGGGGNGGGNGGNGGGSHNAASKETGALMAAVAIAGFVVAVM
ncbi:hypothetical protein CPLU01_12149 [Colletotrichum plurivorum]|uniref:Infection structure specific protein n=1 Tax=Colletotrichum plurivorum TaxID=2175906 RepID=A0A8H6K0J6_9PEZI|nr:hypothetical protein CPLU01_12149 [Colletotrichum plurivorum]